MPATRNDLSPKPTRRDGGGDVLQPLGPAPVLIDVDRIEPHPDNPRQTFDELELQGLADSLTSLRLINPIQLLPHDSIAERYRVISGERRWRAAQLAGWTTIPAFVLRVGDDVALEIMVAENLQRKDLNPLERCRAIALLVKPKVEGGAGLTHAAVGKRFRKDASWSVNLVRILKLPDAWQQQLAGGELGLTEARLLVSYVDRPDVLAAVAVDRDRNPNDWHPRIKFERQLAAIVERLDGVAKPAAVAGVSPDKIGAAGLQELVEAAGPQRRSAPVDHRQVAASEAAADVDPHAAGAEPAELLDQVDAEALRSECHTLLDALDVEYLLQARRYLQALGGEPTIDAAANDGHHQATARKRA